MITMFENYDRKDIDPYGEENWSDKPPQLRHITIYVFDRDSSANYLNRIVFTNDMDEMENRLNDVIEESGFRKCYIESESSDQFTVDEIESLEGIGIDIF